MHVQKYVVELFPMTSHMPVSAAVILFALTLMWTFVFKGHDGPAAQQLWLHA